MAGKIWTTQPLEEPAQCHPHIYRDCGVLLCRAGRKPDAPVYEYPTFGWTYYRLESEWSFRPILAKVYSVYGPCRICLDRAWHAEPEMFSNAIKRS